MRTTIILIYLILLSCLKLSSQDRKDKPLHNWTRFLHLETGIIYPNGAIKESIAIRQNISSYYVNQSSGGYISSATSGLIAGLRWEYFNPALKAGISTGLRYTGFNSEISGFTSSNADFFYLRYSMMNSDTKFARVKSITETCNFISIPLEIRYIPIFYKGLALFAKAGIEFSGINLKKGTDIVFQDKAMEVNQDIILAGLGEANNTFYSALYGSIGLKLGRDGKPNYMFEVFLPSLFLTKNNFILSEVDYFEGFKVSVQFPFTKHN